MKAAGSFKRVDRFGERPHGEQAQALDDRGFGAIRAGQEQRADALRAGPPRQSAARRAPRGSPPSSDSSPSSSTSSTSRRATSPDAASTPSAIGRSNEAPALRMSAGARLTVMRSIGNSNPELRIALRTRSRLSRTLASGRPTMLNAGQAERHVHFDLHRAGLDPEHRRRPHAGKHARVRAKARAAGIAREFRSREAQTSQKQQRGGGRLRQKPGSTRRLLLDLQLRPDAQGVAAQLVPALEIRRPSC